MKTAPRDAQISGDFAWETQKPTIFNAETATNFGPNDAIGTLSLAVRLPL